MKKTVMVMLLRNRRASAVRVQAILTEYGCLIKTRLGIHDGVLDRCSDVGLVLFELMGDPARKKALAKKLAGVSGVKVKLVDIAL